MKTAYRTCKYIAFLILPMLVLSACARKSNDSDFIYAQLSDHPYSQSENEALDEGNETGTEAGTGAEKEIGIGKEAETTESASEQSESKEEEEMNSPTVLFQGHASVRIVTADNHVIYIDPFAGDGYDLPADLILETHSHFDHTQADLIQSRNEGCQLITWKEALSKGEYRTFDLGYVTVQAVEAGYNKNHNVKECVGFVLTFPNDVKVYFTGDTSKTPQMANLEGIDYAFICCDGVYNMDVDEASECAKLIGATHSIPYHMIPADPKNNFDRDLADSFEAEGKIILEPGEELKLEKQE